MKFQTKQKFKEHFFYFTHSYYNTRFMTLHLGETTPYVETVEEHGLFFWHSLLYYEWSNIVWISFHVTVLTDVGSIRKLGFTSVNRSLLYTFSRSDFYGKQNTFREGVLTTETSMK